ncbi:MAG: hypothetical protein KDA37_05615 [Planctomycetales bacterium]|nr:hypothetical protein [Planctomycetales bacterium]
MRVLLFCVAACLVGATASAAVLDGSIAGDGYGLSSVQTVETQFGDNFSELNAAWTRVESNTLYLTITGNLENNFNKLNIFFDTGAAGGQNVIGPDVNNGGLNPDNDGWAGKYSGGGAGFTFDSAFSANYMMILRHNNTQFDFDFTTVGNASVVESSIDIFGGAGVGANALVGASGIGVAYDDSNVAGVAGGTNAAIQADAIAVTTGIELAIPLAALGNPNPADIKISAMVNGSNHDYLSNQFLGGLASPQGNLGGDGGGTFTGSLAGIDLNQFAGNQYFGVVPEPSALACLALAACGLLYRKRS